MVKSWESRLYRGIPYDKLNPIDITVWKATTAQTVVLRPCDLARKLMRGKATNMGKAEMIPAMNTFLEPQRLWILAKKNTWKIPFRTPKTERMLPMLDGGSPNPPRCIGVE